jgi:hypothetical protein
MMATQWHDAIIPGDPNKNPWIHKTANKITQFTSTFLRDTTLI